MLPFLTLLRPHQWSKNLLVFSAMFFSGRSDAALFWRSMEVFLCLSFVSSAFYCVNDVLDLELDRKHPHKRSRPVASGSVAPWQALLVAALLLSVGFGWAAAISPPLLKVLLVFSILQLAYSKFLKNLPILDVIVLSSFYVVRVLAGAVATEIRPSSWILVFTWLLSLMLAVGKRFVEVVQHGSLAETTRPVLLKYSGQFLTHVISSLGAATLVCYLLWCSETADSGRFSSEAIFPTAVFVTFGIFRYELLLFHRRFAEDPTKGLLTDIPIVLSVLMFVGWLTVIIHW